MFAGLTAALELAEQVQQEPQQPTRGLMRTAPRLVAQVQTPALVALPALRQTPWCPPMPSVDHAAGPPARPACSPAVPVFVCAPQNSQRPFHPKNRSSAIPVPGRQQLQIA